MSHESGVANWGAYNCPVRIPRTSSNQETLVESFAGDQGLSNLCREPHWWRERFRIISQDEAKIDVEKIAWRTTQQVPRSSL
jgi:hypothetical protein